MAVWDFFLNMISPISGSVLYLTTVGNHESDYPNSGNSLLHFFILVKFFSPLIQLYYSPVFAFNDEVF